MTDNNENLKLLRFEGSEDKWREWSEKVKTVGKKKGWWWVVDPLDLDTEFEDEDFDSYTTKASLEAMRVEETTTTGGVTKFKGETTKVKEEMSKFKEEMTKAMLKKEYEMKMFKRANYESYFFLLMTCTGEAATYVMASDGKARVAWESLKKRYENADRADMIEINEFNECFMEDEEQDPFNQLNHLRNKLKLGGGYEKPEDEMIAHVMKHIPEIYRPITALVRINKASNTWKKVQDMTRGNNYYYSEMFIFQFRIFKLQFRRQYERKCGE
jgi:hypothetical protein